MCNLSSIPESRDFHETRKQSQLPIESLWTLKCDFDIGNVNTRSRVNTERQIYRMSGSLLVEIRAFVSVAFGPIFTTGGFNAGRLLRVLSRSV